MGQRAAIYVRVSTTDQSCERQIAELTAFAGRSGFAVLGIFNESASGTRNNRLARNRSSISHRLVGSTRFWSRNCPGGAVQRRIFSIRSTSWLEGVPGRHERHDGRAQYASRADAGRDAGRDRSVRTGPAQRACEIRPCHRQGTGQETRPLAWPAPQIRPARPEGASCHRRREELSLDRPRPRHQQTYCRRHRQTASGKPLA